MPLGHFFHNYLKTCTSTTWFKTCIFQTGLIARISKSRINANLRAVDGTNVAF
jgi:hypothetical protein